ncbi:MAG: SoxR reducing system RseC family protein [Gammaproteobacteria bacterium]|nr:SoxR reducing system RseC family protein [Gammaproteobacteria bacterium]
MNSMIEEQAIVLKVEGDYVWVQTQRQSSCGQCSVKSGCGTSLLSQILGNKATHVRCHNQHSQHLVQGERVLVGLHESALLSGSLLVYFVPLLAMIVFAGGGVLVASIILPGNVDLISIVSAFFGLFIGLRFSNVISKKQANLNFEPVIIKKLISDEYPVELVKN